MGNVKSALRMASLQMMLLLAFLSVSSAYAECPHAEFVESSVCDGCRGWKEVLKQQAAAGATGITTVLGPPTHSFPPLFRQTGVQASDLCIAGHSPLTGELYKVNR